MNKWLWLTSLVIVISAAAFGIEAAQDTPAKNKELCQRFVEEVVNQGKLETIDDLLAPAFIEHEPAPLDYPRNGVESTRRWFRDLRSAFPDLKAEIGDMIAEGDLVAIRATWTGTHRGSLMGAPATGKTSSFEVIDIVRITRGKVVDHWGQWDRAALLGTPFHPSTK